MKDLRVPGQNMIVHELTHRSADVTAQSKGDMSTLFWSVFQRGRVDCTARKYNKENPYQ